MCALLTANEAEAANIAKMLTDEGYSAAVCDGKAGFFGEKKKRYPVAVLYGETFPGFELISSRFALLDHSGVSAGTARVLSRRNPLGDYRRGHRNAVFLVFAAHRHTAASRTAAVHSPGLHYRSKLLAYVLVQ